MGNLSRRVPSLHPWMSIPGVDAGKTLIPVLNEFQNAHDVRDMIVVADAGMLSAAKLLALEDAGFSFIVGSRAAKTPYELADHFKTKGNAFTDG